MNKKGKLIVIEGTDCSGKETQTNLLINKLNEANIKSYKYSFPAYETATGKIIGGPYLGKEYICESWFQEGASFVDPNVAMLYYAADRVYNMPKIVKMLEDGIHVILDRYTYSNMAHQGGKCLENDSRSSIYKKIDDLEFNFLNLPKADIKILLYMPIEYATILKQNRTEAPDGHEKDTNHLINAEKAYLEIANIYDFKTINCVKDNNIRTISDINVELTSYVLKCIEESL